MDGVAFTPAGRIRLEAGRLMASAAQDQIEPDGTLGHWVRAQEAVLHALADMADHFDRTAAELDAKVVASIANMRDLAKAEVIKLQQANVRATNVIEEMRVAATVMHLRADEVVKTFAQAVTPELIEIIDRVTVVRERHWNQRQNWTRVSVAAAAILGIWTLGFFYGGGNFRSKELGEAALVAVQRCREAAQLDRSTKEPWCPVKSLGAPS